jgi:hypothetical protein
MSRIIILFLIPCCIFCTFIFNISPIFSLISSFKKKLRGLVNSPCCLCVSPNFFVFYAVRILSRGLTRAPCYLFPQSCSFLCGPCRIKVEQAIDSSPNFLFLYVFN